MNKEEVKKQLLDVILSTSLQEELEGKTIDTAADFVEEYGVNSITLIEILVASETSFKVSFDDKELALNKYHSFDDVADLIVKKLNA